MKKNIFTVAMFVLVAVFFALMWGVAQRYLSQGKDLNRVAWESSYSERKVKLPESGPRDGYWGSRRGNAVEDRHTIWRDAEVHVSGLLDVDASGYQYFRSPESARIRIVILGASVASGAYASAIDNTYFNILGTELRRMGLPADIVVIASGAWKSTQELSALGHYLQGVKPDLVIFLNGLNDLTGGATARHLYGEPFQSPNGEIADPLYHTHDYRQRVRAYIDNMIAARELVAARGARMLVVLQPSLNERSARTAIEEKVLKASLVPHESSKALANSYAEIRGELLRLEKSGEMDFLDCSQIFDRERETAFADLWHFSDFGHRVLGGVLADRITAILKNGNKENISGRSRVN